MPLPDIIQTPAYRNAFQLYLRKGVPIELSLKAAAAQEIGKYGTPQVHYKGSNGVTVVVEKIGRNAGKIITCWRHQ